MDVTNERVISTIPKNERGEEYRISTMTFRGRNMVNIRVWFRNENGEMQAGRQGVAFVVEKIGDFIQALQDAM